jgi:hypothetical protein
MARFSVTWHINSAAPFPTDPSKRLEMEEKMWAMLDGTMKKGELEEAGIFPEVHNGYLIGKGETVDMFRNASIFFPHIVSEVHEIIPI